MTLADRVRSFVIERWIEPARAAGTGIVRVRVGDVHDAMGLQMRQAAVAAALGANKFQELAKVRRVAIEGPSQGANCVFKFELLPGKRQEDASVARTPSPTSQQGASFTLSLGGPGTSVIGEPLLETGFRERVAQRMQRRVQDLVTRFDDWLERFQTEKLFSGPSIYFHQKTRFMLDRVRLLGDCDAQAVTSCIDDDAFLERLYATLTAWGLHRMGPRGAKLVEFGDLAGSFRQHREAISGLSSRRIDLLRDDEVAPVAGEIWRLIAELKIGSPRTTIVSGSKALHHLLPDLVPPIDRAYTLRFFFGPKVVGEEEEEPAFQVLFPRFRDISVACIDEINKRLAKPADWDTSITKVIDNAIVGYVRAHRAAEPRCG